jgi:hypothetical protein
MRIFYLLTKTQSGKTGDLSYLHSYFDNSDSSDVSFDNIEFQEDISAPAAPAAREPKSDDFSKASKGT